MNGQFFYFRDREESLRWLTRRTNTVSPKIEIDLCPDSLYLKVTGRKPEEIFPSLGFEPVYA
jgi:hypothetical protein